MKAWQVKAARMTLTGREYRHLKTVLAESCWDALDLAHELDVDLEEGERICVGDEHPPTVWQFLLNPQVGP